MENEGGGQIWTASVSVGTALIAQPLPPFAELEDLSPNVTFDFANNHYDELTGTVSVDVGIVNKTTAKRALTAPLLIQVTDLHSDFGPVEAMNADNGAHGVGAIWDLSNLLPLKPLAPGSVSERRRLLFRISSPQLPLGRLSKLVIIRAKVLGKPALNR